MNTPARLLCSAVAVVTLSLAYHAAAHENYLLPHVHTHEHAVHEDHGLESSDRTPHSAKSIFPAREHSHSHDITVFEIGTGFQYTRLSLEGKRAHLWETGVALHYSPVPWLGLGLDARYGWFDSEGTSASGWLIPHAHVDLHLPLAEHWELLVGGEVGFPIGDRDLTGHHWEFSPEIQIRYDRGPWYAAIGGGITFVRGGSHDEHDHAAHAEHSDHEGEEHADIHEHEGEHEGHGEEEHVEEAIHTHEATNDSHAGAHIHEVVDPHGETEWNWEAALGVRLWDERLTLESRLMGVHVLKGHTDDRDYIRAGVRALYRINEHVGFTAGASLPVTDARRNLWQADFAVRVSF